MSVSRLVEFYGGPWDGELRHVPWRWRELHIPSLPKPLVSFNPLPISAEPDFVIQCPPKHVYRMGESTAQYMGMAE